MAGLNKILHPLLCAVLVLSVAASSGDLQGGKAGFVPSWVTTARRKVSFGVVQRGLACGQRKAVVRPGKMQRARLLTLRSSDEGSEFDNSDMKV